MKILIVDDTVSVLAHLQAVIASHDAHEVMQAHHGREALATLLMHPDIDLIFLDLEMPEMDGHTFLRQYKRQKNNAPVIVLSSKTEADMQDAIRLGADKTITKPFDDSAILDALQAFSN